MYNKVTLVGRISTDLELKQTQNGKSYCRFNLAVNRMNEGTDFIPVTLWGKSAESTVTYQKKGSLILIDGSINIGNYTDSNGNKRTSFEVIAQNVQFLGSKNSSANVETNNDEIDNSTSDEDVFSQFGEQVNIDDNFLEDDFLE